MNVCYTAIFGDADILQDPKVITKGWKYICFTDQDFKSETYEIIKMEGDQWKSRELKTIPHRYFDYERVIWHDGCFTVNCNLDSLPVEFLVKHPFHNCAYDEIELCWQRGKETKEKLVRCRLELERINYPKNKGCYAMGIFGRGNSEVQNRLNESWWSIMQEFTVRDQIFFPYLVDAFDINPHKYTWEQALDLFYWHKHVK